MKKITLKRVIVFSNGSVAINFKNQLKSFKSFVFYEKDYLTLSSRNKITNVTQLEYSFHKKKIKYLN
jgi:hypothetical protein